MKLDMKKTMDAKVRQLKKRGWKPEEIARYKAKFKDVDAIREGEKKNPYHGK